MPYPFVEQDAADAFEAGKDICARGAVQQLLPYLLIGAGGFFQRKRLGSVRYDFDFLHFLQRQPQGDPDIAFAMYHDGFGQVTGFGKNQSIFWRSR